MITSIEKESKFIVNILKTWDKLFNGIQIRYAYENDTDFHIVEISPEEIRRGNDEFVGMEFQLNEAYGNEFKNDNLLICEPSKYNDMSNLIYTNIL